LSKAQSSDDDIKRILRKFALLNATLHGGKPELGAVVGRIMAEYPEFRGQSDKIKDIAAEVIDDITQMSSQRQKNVLEEEFPDALNLEHERRRVISRRDQGRGLELPPLAGAVRGEVVTRFPPEPNGFMHIGHAKAAFLGSAYAEKYGGRFILRFDDTNPAAEKREFYTAFLDSLSWLGIRPDRVRNASDHMELFYNLAQKMIEESTAFICQCSQDIMRELRSKSEPCGHRLQSVERNLDLWSDMKTGKIRQNEATLRFVGDMSSLNTTMRDPVLFRIVETSHPIQGTKYRVWPTYDFDGAVEDSLDGVTHAMRSKEYELRDELYHALLRALGMRQPQIVEFSRLSLQNTTVSKRNLKKLITEGKVEGWDDPRLPTISALRRRGFTADAIKEFILGMGVSKVESEPTWDLLESINRKILDPVTKRYFFVPDPVALRVKGAPNLDVRLRYHPSGEHGYRIVKTNGNFFVPRIDLESVAVGDIVRLIEAYNVLIIEKSENLVSASYVENQSAQAARKIQWVNQDENVNLEVKVPGPLLLDEVYNPESLKIIFGVAEAAFKEIPLGEIVQFLRFGFCRIDEAGVAILAHK
jgi:glutamyl-tRNA synthetase